jgi:hypothetical protein
LYASVITDGNRYLWPVTATGNVAVVLEEVITLTLNVPAEMLDITALGNSAVNVATDMPVGSPTLADMTDVVITQL